MDKLRGLAAEASQGRDEAQHELEKQIEALDHLERCAEEARKSVERASEALAQSSHEEKRVKEADAHFQNKCSYHLKASRTKLRHEMHLEAVLLKRMLPDLITNEGKKEGQILQWRPRRKHGGFHPLDASKVPKSIALGLGLNQRKGKIDILKPTYEHVELTKQICKVVRGEDPELCFTSLSINQGRFNLHVDGNNLGDSGMMALGHDSGGDLWEFDQRTSTSRVVPVSKGLKRFDGQRNPHHTLRYKGRRYTITAYIHRGVTSMEPELEFALRFFGFNLPPPELVAELQRRGGVSMDERRDGIARAFKTLVSQGFCSEDVNIAAQTPRDEGDEESEGDFEESLGDESSSSSSGGGIVSTGDHPGRSGAVVTAGGEAESTEAMDEAESDGDASGDAVLVQEAPLCPRAATFEREATTERPARASGNCLGAEEAATVLEDDDDDDDAEGAASSGEDSLGIHVEQPGPRPSLASISGTRLTPEDLQRYSADARACPPTRPLLDQGARTQPLSPGRASPDLAGERGDSPEENPSSATKRARIDEEDVEL